MKILRLLITNLTEKDYSFNIKKSFNVFGLLVSIGLLSNSILEFTRGFYLTGYILISLTVYISYFIFSKKNNLGLLSTILFYFIYAVSIFVFSSMVGMSSGIELFYIPLILTLPISFSNALELKHYILISTIILVFLLINFFTEHNLFSNARYTPKIQNETLYISIFTASACSVWNVIVIFSMMAYNNSYYAKNINIEKKIESLTNERKASEEELILLNELVVSNNPSFYTKFQEIFPHFIIGLKKQYPLLNQKDLEICALIKLNYSTKDIARHTKSSVRSIESKKYRVRKKLNLKKDDEINIWIASFNFKRNLNEI